MSNISFREKSAWASFLSIGLVAGIYFVRILQHALGAASGPTVRFTLTLWAALALLEVALHLAVRAQAPEEARTPKDEREHLIDLKATRAAFPVLLTAAFAAIGTVHLQLGRDMAWVMMQVMLFGIVAAELTRFAAQIAYHRRGL